MAIFLNLGTSQPAAPGDVTPTNRPKFIQLDGIGSGTNRFVEELYNQLDIANTNAGVACYSLICFDFSCNADITGATVVTGCGFAQNVLEHPIISNTLAT